MFLHELVSLVQKCLKDTIGACRHGINPPCHFWKSLHDDGRLCGCELIAFTNDQNPIRVCCVFVT